MRNYLKELDKKGSITRTHGGAILKSKSFQKIALSFRTDNLIEKQNMAKKALEFIDDGDTLILDSGTTIHEIAKLFYSKKNITIITNDITCASILEPNGFDIVVLGGLL